MKMFEFAIALLSLCLLCLSAGIVLSFDYRIGVNKLKYTLPGQDHMTKPIYMGFRPVYQGLSAYQRFMVVIISPLGMNIEAAYHQQMRAWYPSTYLNPALRPELTPSQFETLRNLAVSEIGKSPGFLKFCWQQYRLIRQIESTNSHNRWI